MLNAQPNDPTRAGELASKKITYGGDDRYAIYAVHTRFAWVAWFVTDADYPDENGFPAVIRQMETYAEAIAGLDPGAAL